MTRKGHRTGSPRPVRTGREAGILGRSWPFLGLAFLLYKMEINSLLSLACLLPCNEPIQHHKTGDTKTTTRSLPFNLIVTYRVSHLPSSQVAPVTVSGSIQVDAGCTWLVTPLLMSPTPPFLPPRVCVSSGLASPGPSAESSHSAGSSPSQLTPHL